jgi:hypothetical protein
MSDAYVIEVQGKTVGLIVRETNDSRHYRFLSALHALNDLEGKAFTGPYDAENAARKLVRENNIKLPR